MLFLTFQVDRQRYAVGAKSVREIVPVVKLRRLPGSGNIVGGVFNYRGEMVPVLDLTCVISGRATANQLSSRIILVDYPETADKKHILGLMAERVTSTADCDEGKLSSPNIEIPGSPWLGKISASGKEMVQVVRIENLLPEDIKETLFKEPRQVSL